MMCTVSPHTEVVSISPCLPVAMDTAQVSGSHGMMYGAAASLCVADYLIRATTHLWFSKNFCCSAAVTK